MKLSALIKERPFLVFFLFWLTYFAVFWFRVFSYDSQFNLAALHVNVWGDWAIHLTMGSAMAFRSLFLSESPLLYGAPFRYPFFVNLVSAVLVRMGVPFVTAFTVPSFIYTLFFISCLFIFYRIVLKNARAAFLSSSVFIFNGGVGFYYYIKDILKSSTPFRTLVFPPETYTNIEPRAIKWTSVLGTMIIPQRSFQLGFPLGLVVFLLVLQFLESNPHQMSRKDWVRIFVAGAIWGVLPIIHMHTFVVISFALPFWFVADVLRYKREFLSHRLPSWGLLLLTSLCLAVPLCFAFDLLASGETRVAWFPGWYAREWRMNWLWFWFKNWGVVPLCAIGGFGVWIFQVETWMRKFHYSLMVLPFLLVFALSNLFVFHPWMWDNTKFLMWSSLVISGFAGYFIYSLWFGREPEKGSVL